MTRQELIAAIGMGVAAFQEEAASFDSVAAQVLALERHDLPCLTMLLFAGPLAVDELEARLQQERSAVASTLSRMELAGYARRSRERGRSTVELTEHARRWISQI